MGSVACVHSMRSQLGNAQPPQHLHITTINHAGSLGFFIFRSRTTAFYFSNDVQVGGGGRGCEP